MKLHKLRGPDAQRKGEVFGTTATFQARQIAQVFAWKKFDEQFHKFPSENLWEIF